MKDLGDALQWLLDAVQIWLQCAARPVATLNAILLKATNEKQLSAAAKVCVPSLLISLIVTFPALKFYGIEWSNLGFHLCNWTTTIIALVATAFIIHQVLLALRLKSEFVRTLFIYTVLVATYTPVTTLLAVPMTLYNFAAVYDLKLHPVAIYTAVIAYFHNTTKLPSFFFSIIDVSSIFSSLLSFAILALFAEYISQWYSNNRFKCYSAVAFSATLSSAMSLLIITPMQFLIMYAFVPS